MIYVDSRTKEELSSVDMTKGEVKTKTFQVYADWVEDSPAVYEDVVTNTFPNGGVELERVVKKEATGHWEVTMEDGEKFPYAFDIAEGVPHEGFSEYVTIGYFTPYTEAKLAEIESNARIAERINKAVQSLPETQADVDEVICELYEGQIANSGTIAEQDAAICELYEMILGA